MKSHRLFISELNQFYHYFNLNDAYETHKLMANFHSNTGKCIETFILHSVLYSPKVQTHVYFGVFTASILTSGRNG
jgi:hypothetical protein